MFVPGLPLLVIILHCVAFPVVAFLTSSPPGLLTPALTELQNRHGIGLREIRELGLTSQDLVDLGITSVQARLAILRESHALAPGGYALAVDDVPKQDFAFIVSHFNSSRQFGKCLNIVVKYRYISGKQANSTGGGYLDYREVRRLVLEFAQPSEQLPNTVQWELINQKLVQEIYSRYSEQVMAVSSQIQVLSEVNHFISEPGNHGSIVTISKDNTFVPLAEPWVNAFRYDCTKTNQPN